jgi:hypothetical protein
MDEMQAAAERDEAEWDFREREVLALERIADALEAMWYKQQPDVKPSTWVKVRGVTLSFDAGGSDG